MKIQTLYKDHHPLLSFEIFPPKRGREKETVYQTIDEIAKEKPAFISVTYGAAGSERNDETLAMAAYIQKEHQIPSLAHMTCSGLTKKEIDDTLNKIEGLNIENVLLLRGDETKGKAPFPFASDLIEYVHKIKPHLSIGAACYPESHINAKSKTVDLIHLKRKVDAGTDFLISQLFFDNTKFYEFLFEARSLDINVPIFAGIMPVLARNQIERMVELSGATLPPKFKQIIEKYEHKPKALQDAGIAYACEQMVDLLASGVDGIHLYVMNKPEVAKRLSAGISSILGD